jgi:hypothetical protein
MLYSCMLTLTYLGIFMLYLCFTRASPLLIYVTFVFLFCFNILIHTPALLVLYSYFSCCVCCVRVCVSRLTGLVECVQYSEGLRRDGGWEHDVLQQRAAGQAPLEEAAAHVCVLMHVGAAQARTRLLERQRVSTAAQVRDACHMMPAYPI